MRSNRVYCIRLRVYFTYCADADVEPKQRLCGFIYTIFEFKIHTFIVVSMPETPRSHAEHADNRLEGTEKTQII